MQIIKDYITNKTKRRPGIPIVKVGFLVAHDTGNLGSTARNNVDYFKRTAAEIEASAHLFVDDKEAIECIPAFASPEKAWHVRYLRPEDNQFFGDDANDIAIGVEYCFFEDRSRSLKSYYNYVELLVKLCRLYHLDPVSDIVAHSKLDPGRKTDPNNGLRYAGKDFDDLIRDVRKGLTMTDAKQKGIAAIRSLAKMGRLSQPEVWENEVISGKVPNLEWLFVKWEEDAKRGSLG